MSTKKFTIELMKLLKKVKEEHGDNAIVTIRVDDYGVTVEDVVTRKMLYDADTLPEFTWRFYPKGGE